LALTFQNVRLISLLEDTIEMLIPKAQSKSIDLYIIQNDQFSSSSEGGSGYHFSISGGIGATARTL